MSRGFLFDEFPKNLNSIRLNSRGIYVSAITSATSTTSTRNEAQNRGRTSTNVLSFHLRGCSRGTNNSIRYRGFPSPEKRTNPVKRSVRFAEPRRGERNLLFFLSLKLDEEEKKKKSRQGNGLSRLGLACRSSASLLAHGWFC